MHRLVLLTGLLVALSGTASATDSSLPPERWGRRLTPGDASAAPIPDPGTLRQELRVEHTGRVAWVEVRVELTHARPEDLTLRLTSPAGTTRVLAQGAGAVSGTYGGDRASLEPLERLEGEEPRGVWTLELVDGRGGAAGRLLRWGLTIQLASRATQTKDDLQLPKETKTLRVGWRRRKVHYQTPLGNPPPQGWPLVVFFQGSLFTSDINFVGWRRGPFGMWHQARTMKLLLDAGFAVVAPEAKVWGATFWDTNVPLLSSRWERTPDHALMLALFDALDQGEFGPVDAGRYYATGISSGGYMTSRMALSYPGRFRALAIQSAAWATSSGPIDLIPDAMPMHHPPTLFLHGRRDPVVPVWTMRRYHDALAAAGYEVRSVVDDEAMHAWIPQAPTEVRAWFEAH